MQKNTHTSDILKLATLTQQIKLSTDVDSNAMINKYLRYLNELMGNGWSYAHSKENEIDKHFLPIQYTNRRNKVIEELQIKLTQWAALYRATTSSSENEISQYHQTFTELLRITGKVIALDPDAELPDGDMPKIYVDFWL